MAKRLVETKGAILRRPLAVTALLGAALAVAIAISGSAIAKTTTCSSTATLEKSAFEIDADANLVVNTSGCIDWLTGGADTGFRAGVSAKNDKPTGGSDDSFGQGTAEDNPNPTIVDGSIPPNKSDLKAFGVFSETGQADPGGPNPSGKFLELFWSRVQNPSGTTNMDFELNKEFCDGTADHCANNGTAKNPIYKTPKRTAGDKLITYDLSKGGTVPAISIRTWTGSAWGAATVISGGGATATALGSVNTSTIPANQTGGTTGGLDPSLGQQDPFTFGEASIAYSAIFSGNACGTFGSAYLKSRSSDSFTAEIKDFVEPEPVSISNCTTLVTSAAETVTVGSTIHDTATLGGAVSPTGSITFKLYRFNLSDPSAGDTCDAAHLLTTITVNAPFTSSGSDFTASASYNTTQTGRYRWVANYTSGDANNVNAGPTACLDAAELDTVNKAQPSISTTLSDESITVGDSIHDSATLSGATANAGGTVTYTVYTNNTCTQGARDAGTKTVANGSVPDSDTLAFNSAGTFYWQAVYSGDANNEGATSVCTSEILVVGKAPSSVATVQRLFPQDKATVSAGAGGTPTGSVTFSLYGPGDTSCSGSTVYSETVPLSGGEASTSNTTFSVVAGTSGTYRWIVSYSGDSTHDGSTSACGTEQFTATITNS